VFRDNPDALPRPGGQAASVYMDHLSGFAWPAMGLAASVWVAAVLGIVWAIALSYGGRPKPHE